MDRLGKRIARLEVIGSEEDYLPLALLDDLVGTDPLIDWPEGVAGVRFLHGPEWLRREGEALDDFRHRVSAEIGRRGPPGGLPHIVELI